MPARPPPRGKAAPFPPGATRGPPFPILELKFEVEFGTGIFRLAGATGGGEGWRDFEPNLFFVEWSYFFPPPFFSFSFIIISLSLFLSFWRV